MIQNLLRLLCVLCVGFIPHWVQASSCSNTASSIITETFDTDTFRNISTTTVEGWGTGIDIGTVKLKRRGGLFGPGVNASVFAGVYATASGDFDQDGDIDLMGVTQQAPAGDGTYLCDVYFFQNDGSGNFSKGMMPIYTSEAWPVACGFSAILVAGNINKDSMIDLLYANSEYHVVGSTRYFHTQAQVLLGASALPTYTLGTMMSNSTQPFYYGNMWREQFTAPNANGHPIGHYWYWGASLAKLMDYDADGDDDLLVGSMLGQEDPHVVWHINNMAAQQSFGIGRIASQYKAGGVTWDDVNLEAFNPASLVLAEDFDGDGDTDLIVANYSNNSFAYLTRVADGGYVRTNISFPPGGISGGCAADLDRDGDMDLVIGCRALGPNCNGTDPANSIYTYLNNGTGTFTLNTEALGGQDSSNPLNWLKTFDPDVTDTNPYVSIVAGFKNGAYIYPPRLNPPYYTPATAASRRYDTFGVSSTYAIVKVTMTNKVATLPPGTAITYWVSNNQGNSWEEFTPEELSASPATHVFSSLGNRLRWKMILSGPDCAPANLNGYPAINSACDSPSLESFSFYYEYTLSAGHSYSRSGLALGQCDNPIPGQPKVECLFSASFSYPNFNGHLFANNLSALSDSSFTRSSYERIDGVGMLYDAGVVLSSPSQIRTLSSTRDSSVLLVYALNSGNIAYGEFNLGSSTDLTALDTYIKNGMQTTISSWRLFDSGHSSPLYVGPPSADADYMDKIWSSNPYANFKSSQAGRIGNVFLGGNDGGLHGFAPASRGYGELQGFERWVFVPRNLKTKLNLQRNIEDISSPAVYEHNFYVDGPLVAADVNGSFPGWAGTNWRTIVVAGQGQGSNAQGDNYYFALGIGTNPWLLELRNSLWEFSATWDGVCTTDCPPILGQTFSKPVVTRVSIGNAPKWVVFFGSGYNNRPTVSNVGRSIFMLDAITGTLLAHWDTDDIAGGTSANPSTIDNTIPGGPAVVDINDDGYADRLYVGDLEGRLWKLDMQADLANTGNWKWSLLFDAGLSSDGSNNRRWAPIVTTPAIALLDSSYPNVYFGTGGDDRAPNDQMYYFYSVRDVADVGVVRAVPLRDADLSIIRNEWIVGDTAGESEVGDKYWSDPVIADSSVVYFTALSGTIESVDPCTSADRPAKLFGYAIRDFKDASGHSYRAGTSVLVNSSNNPIAWLNTDHKVRSSVVLRSWSTNPPYATVRPVDLSAISTAATDVIFQEFSGDSPTDRTAISRIMGTGVSLGTPRSRVRILRMREMSAD